MMLLITRSSFLYALMNHQSHITPHYSYLNASTGFLIAALHVCQLTVKKAIPTAIIPARAKIHQLRSVLKAKF